MSAPTTSFVFGASLQPDGSSVERQTMGAESAASGSDQSHDFIKHRDHGIEQRRRRESVLSLQRSRRAAAQSLSRGMPPAVPSCTEGEPLSSADRMPSAAGGVADSMDTSEGSSNGNVARRRNRKGSRQPAQSAAEVLMSAEWLVDMPSDLSRNWYVLARPAGWRCLVSTGGGATRALGRAGGKPRTFASALPNGSRQTGAGPSCVCELDCVWSEADQTYYVLDLLRWKEHCLRECAAELRLFWLHSKLAEAGAEQPSAANPCRFVALPAVPCRPAALHAAYAVPPPVGAQRDGLLLLHREALYEPGASPLLLSWADGTCSERFYDYGSVQMADALARSPDKALRWRTDERHAAITFDELLDAARRSDTLHGDDQMSDDLGGGERAPLAPLLGLSRAVAEPIDAGGDANMQL